MIIKQGCDFKEFIHLILKSDKWLNAFIKNKQHLFEQRGRRVTTNILTSKDNSGKSIIEPNHAKIAFNRANIEINAINMTAMFATRLMDIDAPTANASNTFVSSLERSIETNCATALKFQNQGNQKNKTGYPDNVTKSSPDYLKKYQLLANLKSSENNN